MQFILNLVKFANNELSSTVSRTYHLAFIVVVVIHVFLIKIRRICPKSWLLINCFWGIALIANIITVIFSLFSFWLELTDAVSLLSERIGTQLPTVG
jgi:hypothetical protein